MNTTIHAPTRSAGFELRFQSLFDEGRGLAFPCDDTGHVDIDALTLRARDKYLYARALIGREFSYPKMCRALAH